MLAACGFMTTKEDNSLGETGAGDSLDKAIEAAPAIVNSFTNLIWTGALVVILLALAFPRTRAMVRWFIESLFAWATQWFQKRTKEEFRPPAPPPTS
jgi:hypothetical protein